LYHGKEHDSLFKKYRNIRPQLSEKNLQRAKKILFDVVDLLEEQNIGYHLEGGTLLGMVRDNGIIPWDWDIDLSFLAEDTDKFLKVYDMLKEKGYKITNRRLKKTVPPFRKGNYRIFKVKPFLLSILKECIPFFKRIYVTADIFVKYRDDSRVYWIAKEKIMRVDKRYYESYETIECYGREFRVPNHYKDYLTEKYGDWSVPVKEWDCSRDEKTVCGEAG
jgi:phosphorylcholine metabolism protein LicD